MVVGGPLSGKSLGDLFTNEREWLMGVAWTQANPAATTFPLLFKYLDCNRVLSVQVHPDDEYGSRMDPPDLGKTEAWVILASEPESVIYSGLKEGIDREQLASLIADGRTEEALHSFHPEPGDCVFIPAGTVHALGGGLLVAEIQQSSNTTFRLFDWNRTDAAGKSRDLHVEPSLKVTDYVRGPVQPRRLSAQGGLEALVDCDKFNLRRLSGLGETIGGDDRCHLLSVIRGEVRLTWAGTQSTSQQQTISLGESVLLPAAMGATTVDSSDATVLWMTPAAQTGVDS